MENMTIEEEWLESLMSEHTRDHHQRGLFKEYLDRETEQLIEMKKKERTFETRVIMFFKWLQKERKLTQNTARSYCIGVQSFFSYIGLPLRLRNKLPKLHMKLEAYRPLTSMELKIGLAKKEEDEELKE